MAKEKEGKMRYFGVVGLTIELSIILSIILFSIRSLLTTMPNNEYLVGSIAGSILWLGFIIYRLVENEILLCFTDGIMGLFTLVVIGNVDELAVVGLILFYLSLFLQMLGAGD